MVSNLIPFLSRSSDPDLVFFSRRSDPGPDFDPELDRGKTHLDPKILNFQDPIAGEEDIVTEIMDFIVGLKFRINQVINHLLSGIKFSTNR